MLKMRKFSYVIALSLMAVPAVAYLDVKRWDRSGKEESSNLGDYEFFTCSGEGADRTCSPDIAAGITYGSVSYYYNYFYI